MNKRDSGNILMTFESGIMVLGAGGSFYLRENTAAIVLHGDRTRAPFTVARCIAL